MRRRHFMQSLFTALGAGVAFTWKTADAAVRKPIQWIPKMTRTRATSRKINFYGLEHLGYRELIPLTGDWASDQLSIEMVCFRIGHLWDETVEFETRYNSGRPTCFDRL